jgi:hypothetical protein
MKENTGINQEAFGSVPVERVAVGNSTAYSIADSQKTMPSMKRVDFDPSSSTRTVAAKNAVGEMAGE